MVNPHVLHTSYAAGCRRPTSAIHLNFLPSAKPSDESAASKLDDIDQKCVERSEFYGKYEFAYMEEHATKTATISMICESSPVALLAW